MRCEQFSTRVDHVARCDLLPSLVNRHLQRYLKMNALSGAIECEFANLHIFSPIHSSFPLLLTSSALASHITCSQGHTYKQINHTQTFGFEFVADLLLLLLLLLALPPTLLLLLFSLLLAPFLSFDAMIAASITLSKSLDSFKAG
jgi:hypothetical protein